MRRRRSFISNHLVLANMAIDDAAELNPGEKTKPDGLVEISHSTFVDSEKHRTFLAHECRYHSASGRKVATGAIGGTLTYSYTPTTVGTTVWVQCACGKKDDITDYSLW